MNDLSVSKESSYFAVELPDATRRLRHIGIGYVGSPSPVGIGLATVRVRRTPHEEPEQYRAPLQHGSGGGIARRYARQGQLERTGYGQQFGNAQRFERQRRHFEPGAQPRGVRTGPVARARLFARQ